MLEKIHGKTIKLAKAYDNTLDKEDQKRLTAQRRKQYERLKKEFGECQDQD